MDVEAMEKALAHEMVEGWEIVPTGGGVLITTNWRLPNRERIEIHVRTIGERENLFLVTDGGETHNLFFVEGLDLQGDKESGDTLADIASSYGAKLVDGQIVKGANEGDLGQAVRWLLEAVKEASFVLWSRLPKADSTRH